MKRLFTMLKSIICAKKRLLVFLAFFIVSSFLIISSVLAQGLDTEAIAKESGLPTVSLAFFIGRLLQIFFGLLGVVALALLIYGGFVWMTATGDPNKVDKAKKIIQNAIIGLVIIFSAFAITTFLMNIFSGGYGNEGRVEVNPIPGDSNDWNRSAIGAGPIESVYPSPNQRNVPINTLIAVTFKQVIDSTSICDANECNGEFANGNIEICETSSTNSNCLSDPVSSTVKQSKDGKTFVFTPQKFLGANDDIERIFKVTLKNGIKASSTNKSIFDGYRFSQYAWQFKTNGKLDLDPPEIQKFGIYPYPDLESDIYNFGSEATKGYQKLTINNEAINIEEPAKLNGEVITKNFKKELDNLNNSGGVKVVIKSKEGFDVINSSDDINFTIGGGVTYAQFSESVISSFKINFSNTGVCFNIPRCLPIIDKKFIETGAGFSIEASSDFIDGLKWSFSVTASSNGDEFSLMDGDSVIANFIFVSSADTRTTVSKTVTSADGRSQVTKDYITVKKGTNTETTIVNLIDVLNSKTNGKVSASKDSNAIIITPQKAGSNNLRIVSSSTNLTIEGTSLSGEDKKFGWTTKGIRDPFNNSIFRITFNEAINPINVSSFIKVYLSTTELQASTTITNQYRTIELKGVTPCGTNACGDPVFCWVNPSTSSPESVPIKIVISAASLRTCSEGDENSVSNEWCKVFGGKCSAGKRCQADSLFYSQAASSLDGITDMSNNSLNGNFNKVKNPKGNLVDNAEGKTGSGLGGSGFSEAYNLNSTISAANGYRPTYDSSDTTGDDFQWSFYLSNQVDNQAPLIKKINPVGNEVYGWQNGQSFSKPVEITFDRLMSFSSLKPGWGYSNNKNDANWFTRYLLLKTLTSRANPIGYWIESADIDEDNDDFADFTKVLINHNPFDQSTTYGPLVGSGVMSITQNCFLPAGAPQRAADPNNQNDGVITNECHYNDSGSATKNCTTDDATITEKVKLPQPASYGYMNCRDIEGAVKCKTGEECKVHYYDDKNVSSTDKAGSWIVTKDHKADVNGITGCCFGKCVKVNKQ